MNLAKRFETIARIVETYKATLIAVSKGQSIESVLELHKLGQRDFGENYAQEFVSKAREIAIRGISDIRWHFIGNLQSNKIKVVAPHSFAIHSIDRENIGSKLNTQIQEHGFSSIKIFLQVKIDSSTTKFGLSPEVLEEFLVGTRAWNRLEMLGLMCIPDSNSNSRTCFSRLRELGKQLRKTYPHLGSDLSMGMSNDFKTALEEGATHIRVGTALFGPRTSSN